MIKSYRGRDAGAHSTIFEDLFRVRHEIYVVRRKWGALQHHDGLERDQYDNSDALYLLGFSAGAKISCGVAPPAHDRRASVSRSFLAFGPAWSFPSGEAVYELTRFFVATSRVAPQHRQRLIAVLGAALFEYCLIHDIETIICVTDAFLIPTMQALHWQPRPLGLPSKYPEGTAVGVSIEISDDTLDRLRSTHGIGGPVLDAPLARTLLAASLPAQMQ